MKIFTLIMCITCVHLGATDADAQHISIHENRIELQKVFEEIKHQTNFNFLFSTKALNNKKPISIQLDEVELNTALHEILKGQSLVFKIIDSTIIIKEKKTTFWNKLKFTGSSSLNSSPTSYFKSTADKITGIVTESSGDRLIGVNVQVKNTSKGTVTDIDGKFEISASTGDTLVFSYIGYKTIEKEVNDLTQINVVLEQNIQELEELIVVGYGIQKKVDLTGAVGALNGEDVQNRKALQVSQALQGAVPGVMVTRGNNAPGATSNIRIRGITTIGNNNPLIIVDGVPVDNINDINPNDIENLSVLKDAASASIYGSRAAAGVILITTKRAKEGRFEMKYDVNFGIEKPTALPEYVGLKRYLEMTNELRWNDNGNNSEEYPVYSKDVVDNYFDLNAQDPNQYPITDWVDLIMNDNAPRQSHNLSISGGSKNIQTNASIAFDKIDALYDDRTYNRITTRVNNNVQINDYLTAKIDLNFKTSNSEQPVVDPMYTMLIAAPIYAAFWEDGRIASGKSGNNIYARMKYGGFEQDQYNSLGGRLALDFTPIKNLVFTGVFSPNLRNDKGKYFRKQVPYTAADNPNLVEGVIEGTETTYLSEYRNEGERYTTQLLANYNTELGKHSLGFLAGFENFYSKNESLSASRDQYTLTSFPYLNQGPLEFRDNGGSAFESAYRSFFGRILYSYDSKYLFQANIRRDGSSRFHQDYRWGSFPSVSLGWIASNESFLKNHKTISFLKLRASYGQLGNERIGNYPYQATISFSNAYFLQGNEVVSEITAAQFAFAIKDISWETTESLNFGIDMNFFHDKLQFSADYFTKNTKDMLLSLEIPDYIGFDNPDQNTGVMKSRGWEFQTAWQESIGEFNYSISANVSDFTSEMGDLGGTEFLGDKIKREGSEFDEWYGYRTDGLFQSQEEIDNSPTINSNVRPGDVKFLDISGPDGNPDGIISPEYDRVLLGGSLPRFIFGGQVKLGYRNLSLNLSFQGVGKQNSRIEPIMVRSLVDNWGNIPAILEGNYWSHYNTDEENLNALYPRLTRVNDNTNFRLSDYWLFNGRYFRVKNLTLGYDLPKHWTDAIGLDNIGTYVSASDFLTFSKYPKGWDPEVSATGYPITTQFLFGLSIKF